MHGMAQDRGWKKGNGSAGLSLRVRTIIAQCVVQNRRVMTEDGGAGQSLRIRREAATCVAQNRGGKRENGVREGA